VRKTDKAGRLRFDAKQRLLLLDAWLRSKLPAKDFGGLVGVSPHTLYKWKQRFEAEGPGGLEDRPKKTAGKSRLPDTTQRAILLMKEAHPDWGQDRIHDMLVRTEGFAASAGAIGRVLSEAGYVVEETPTRRHPDKKRRFERARPNQMWQTDLFTRSPRPLPTRDPEDPEELISAPQSPLQNCYVEQVIGSIRRECTDHIIPMGEMHLQRTLREYVEYYNESRTHQSLGGNAPLPREVEFDGEVVATPVLSGLHHRYSRAA
jgi:transposase